MSYPYLFGTSYGLPKSCMVHPLANIAGELTAGESCRIDPFVTITGRVTLGKNVHVGIGACIFGAGGVEIGDEVSIASGCKIFSATEDADSGMLSNPTITPHYARTAPVVIGARAVIGANSVVMPGVSIGEDTQVGALSFVNATLPGGQIYAGIPVRRLRAKPRLKQIKEAA